MKVRFLCPSVITIIKNTYITFVQLTFDHPPSLKEGFVEGYFFWKYPFKTVLFYFEIGFQWLWPNKFSGIILMEIVEDSGEIWCDPPFIDAGGCFCYSWCSIISTALWTAGLDYHLHIHISNKHHYPQHRHHLSHHHHYHQQHIFLLVLDHPHCIQTAGLDYLASTNTSTHYKPRSEQFSVEKELWIWGSVLNISLYIRF